MQIGQNGHLEIMVKYNETLKIPNEVLVKYYKRMINSFFKILPIYQGMDSKTKRVVYLPHVAYEQFQQYVSNLLVEIYGNSGLFFESEYSVQIVSILRGILIDIKMDELKRLKPLVFQCISLCNKVIEELEVDGNGV